MATNTLRLVLGATLVACVALIATEAGATRLFRSNYSGYLTPSSGIQHRWHAIAADLDGDGRDDLLTSTWNSSVRGVEVRMSGLAGELSPNYTSYTVGYGGDPTGLLAAADLDGDGHLDVLYSNLDSLDILPGLGGGLLGAVQRVSVPDCDVGAIAVADLNADGKLDVAVTRVNVKKVSVLWGAGGFALAPGPEFSTDFQPLLVSIADLNGDGRPDVVVGANNTATVLLADGSGGFTSSSVVASRAIVTGDLNGDGVADMAATGGAMLGNGDGTFQSPIPHAISRPRLTTDLNEDGRLDLMGLSTLNHVQSQLGRGDGTFEPMQEWLAYSDAWTLAAGDLDADGHMDVVKSTYTGNASFVHHGLGNGELEHAPFFAAGLPPTTIALGNLNGDAFPDIVMGSYSTRFISVLRSTGPVAYDTPLVYPVPVGQRYLRVADLNGDGRDDVATATDSSTIVSTWLAQPDGSLGERLTLALPGAVRDFVLADLDLDGHRDIVYHYSDIAPPANSGSGFALGAGNGTFQGLHALGYNFGGPLAVADMNGDGLPDLIGYSGNNDPRLAFATAPGTYPYKTDLTGGSSFISGLAVGRWDQDSIPDLLVYAGTYKVFRGLGGGAFDAGNILPEVSTSVAFRAWTDLNGDGLSDIVGLGFQTAFVCLAQPSGTFEPAAGFGVSRGVNGLTVGDVDGNGRPDLVAGTSYVNGSVDLNRATVLLNQLSPVNVGVEPRTGSNARLAVRVSPNPSTGEIRLSLRGSETSPAQVELLDVAGRVLRNERLPAGASELVIGRGRARALAPGLYFARVRRGGGVVTSRICVVR